MSFNDMMKSEELIVIIVILIMSLIGSLSKDYINLMKQGIKMKVGRILLSTICSSMITYTISIYIIDKLYFRGLVGISYFIGLLGFELVSKFSNLSDIIRMYFLAKFGLDPDRLQKIEESLEKMEEKLEGQQTKETATNNASKSTEE